MDVARPPLTHRTLLRTWWPLAASWMLMGLEMPSVAAVLTRLPDSEQHLAAFGGVVFPLSLLIESPIIMMLAASTALCVDMNSFVALRRFMTRLAAVLTAVHLLVAFTPLFDLIVIHLIGAEEVLEEARTGMRLMSLWTWAIADRRFHQGLLIRFGRQHQVGIGTVIRLIGTAVPLGVALIDRTAPGVVIAGLAFTSGVFFEAVYARLCARPVRLGPLAQAPRADHHLTLGRLLAFYVPLALSPLLALATQPIGSAGITRMPLPLASLAIWPVLNGVVFLLRSTGVAFNEVSVRHAGDPGAARRTMQFAWIAGGIFSGIMVVFAATPISTWWFADVTGLSPELTRLARDATWWAVLMPLLSFLHSGWQGRLLHTGRTRAITEAVVLFLLVTAVAIGAAVLWKGAPGAGATLGAMTLGAIAQAAWLWRASRSE